MKAMVYHKYGSPDVVQLEEVEKPAAKDNEVLIKVHAISVSPADWHFRSGTPFLARMMAGGLLKPKTAILGLDVAGEIESVGASVQRLQPGDQVYGLVETGKLRSVIDRTYPLSELAEAHRCAEEGHVRGRVVITVPD